MSFAAALAAPPAYAQQKLAFTACLRDDATGESLVGARIDAHAVQREDAAWSGTTDAEGCASVVLRVTGIDDLPGAEPLAVEAVYPNPADRELHLRVRSDRVQRAELIAFDLLGREVLRAAPTRLLPGENALALDVSRLADGVYAFRLVVEDGRSLGGTFLRGTFLRGTTPGGGGQAVHRRESVAAAVEVQIHASIAETHWESVRRMVDDGERFEIDLEREKTPLIDMPAAGVEYFGYAGGLYPDEQNDPPADHLAEGLARAASIEPLAPDGSPDPNGAVVLLSVGFSNVSQEFCHTGGVDPDACEPWSFVGQALAQPPVDCAATVAGLGTFPCSDLSGGGVVPINGAKSGRSIECWTVPEGVPDCPRATVNEYDRVRDERLAPLGLSDAQVQVVWLKAAHRLSEPPIPPPLPAPAADAFALEANLGRVLRAMAERYPNLEQVFVSSRIYAGYATVEPSANPEPYAYESGFTVKWLVEAQIRQMRGEGVDLVAGDLDYGAGVAPWVAWGPYLWADGLEARSDGLIWEEQDFEIEQGDGPNLDGIHPSQQGEQKVGTALLEFFTTSPFTACWFVDDGTCG